MLSAIGLSRSRRFGLGLAFVALALQLASLSLAPLVVCFKTDRAPQFELFSGFCSCRALRAHAVSGCEDGAFPCLEEGCFDMQLPCHSILAPPPREPDPARCGSRRLPVAGHSAGRLAVLARQQAWGGRGSPLEPVPPPAFPFSDSRRRC